MSNCKYCGFWNCTPEAPLCDEQKNGAYADHPCRKFKNGDWVEHPVYGIGQVAWVSPIEKGLRITFKTANQTDWYTVDGIKNINDVIFPAQDMNGKEIKTNDNIMYPMPKGGDGDGARICKGSVVSIAKEATHRGYGYYTRQLKLRPSDGGKIVTHNYPSNCLLI